MSVVVSCLIRFALAAVVAMLATAAPAQSYPTRPIRLLVSFPAGRRVRPDCPHAGPTVECAPRSAGRGGEPTRLEREPRRRARRARGARRLYAAAEPKRAVRHQSASLFQNG